jgi:hypothetical protein
MLFKGVPMTVWNDTTSAAKRYPAATTLAFGALGFLCGFLLSLIVAAYSLYACVYIS